MKLNRHVSIVEGSLFKNMLLFCIPIIFTNCIQLLYNSADIMIVGKFGSDAALSGVSASTPLINLIVNFFIGLSVGINVVVSNRIGANDKDAAQKAVQTTVILAFFVGIIAMSIGLFSARKMLLIMSTPAEALEQATTYVRFYFLGVPGIIFTNFGSSILRSNGDTKRPLYFMLVSGFINVLLNLVLVIVFHLDAAGVAIATSVSNYVSATLVLLSLTKIDSICRLNFKNIKFSPTSALDILKIGLPSGINSSMYSISNALIQSSVNKFGQYAVSGAGIATNLDNFLSLSLQSVYHAAMTFTGQNHGAKKHQRLRPILFTGFLINIIIWCVIGGIIITFRTPLLSLFSNNKEVISYALQKVMILAPAFIIAAFMDTITGCLRGLGRPTLPMIVSILGVCVLRVLWIYTVFARFPYLITLYISYPVSWILTFLVDLVIYLFVSGKVIKKLKNEAEE